jgi:hypothetical protein
MNALWVRNTSYFCGMETFLIVSAVSFWVMVACVIGALVFGSKVDPYADRINLAHSQSCEAINIANGAKATAKEALAKVHGLERPKEYKPGMKVIHIDNYGNLVECIVTNQGIVWNGCSSERLLGLESIDPLISAVAGVDAYTSFVKSKKA